MRAAGNNAPLQTGIAALGNIAMNVLHKKRTLPRALRHYGTHALQLTGNNLIEDKLRPILKAPVVGPILNKTVMPIVRRKVDSAIESLVQKAVGQRGKGVATNLLKAGAKAVGPVMKTGMRAIFKRGVKKQLKKGAQQLAQTAAEQAISSAAKAGADILKGKSAKQAVQQRTSQAVKRTYDQMAAPILAKTGPVAVKKKRRKREQEISLIEKTL